MQTAYHPDLTGRTSEIDFKLLGQGFDLANFLLRDRSMAIEVLTNALGKLRAQRSRERKRNYWRAKFLKNRVTRVTRTEQDMLQWLVCIESTPYEEARERAGRLTTRDWIVTYVKTLVQTTSAMSSFYVSIALQRLLYDYTTAETQKTYEWLTDLYPNAEAYRGVKAVLMNRLRRRFDQKLTLCHGERGEVRFEAHQVSKEWIGLVQQSLRVLTPWSTQQVCIKGGLDELIQSGNKQKGYKRNAIDVSEICWCHAFVEPDCFEALTRRLALRSPWERIMIPRFADSGSENDKHLDCEMKDARLTPEESADIMRKIEEKRGFERQVPSPKSVLIVADGAHFVEFGIGERPLTVNGELTEGTRLLEFWIRSDSQSILWATHWIEYTKWGVAALDEVAIDLPGGTELWVDIGSTQAERNEQRRVGIQINCRPEGFPQEKSPLFRSIRLKFTSLDPQYAAAALIVLCVAWISVFVIQRRHLGKDEFLIRQMKAGIAEQKASNNALHIHPPEQIAKTLIPEESRLRGTAGAMQENTIHLSSRSDLLTLDLPISTGEDAYRAVIKPFLASEAIFDEIIPSSNRDNTAAIVHLQIPSSLVQGGHQYVVDLYLRTSRHSWTRLHTFRFTVVGY